MKPILGDEEDNDDILTYLKVKWELEKKKR
ncbi:MAG: hypothetical protein PWR22_297 [Moorella sp. (in: firmicutes)]|jgi:hypothetical protein|nr:hypothetical protein [Moorella sp. (in: firmicutes)]GEA16295.1 hypothetical protein E308F_25390 [Moorella sp. E308F]